jgi:hypothetical protein
MLEEKAVGAGTVTFQGLERHLDKCLEKAGIQELINKLSTSQTEPPSVTTTIEPPATSPSIFFYNNKFWRVPQEFSFPDCNTSTLWQLWNEGNDNRRIPPYKTLKAKDLPLKNLSKRLSDIKFLMSKIENKATELGISIDTNTTGTVRYEHLNEVFHRCRSAIAIPDATTQNRRRRKQQLSWRTVVNELRKQC